MQAGKFRYPEDLIPVQVATVGLRRIGIGRQKTQYRTIAEANRVAFKLDTKELLRNTENIETENFRLGFTGGKEYLILARENGLFKPFPCKIVGKSFLSPFQNEAEQFVAVLTHILLIFKQMTIRFFIKYFFCQSADIIFT